PAPYLANRNVQWERCSLDDLDEMDFTQSERVKYSLEPGDVLVCEGGEVGRTAIWYGELETCFFQKAIHRLRARGQVMPEFMLHYMKYASELDLFKMYTSQTSIAHLTSEQLACLSIPVPSKEVQASVVRALAALSERLEVESEELQKTRRMRNGLAIDLLSGGVRTVAA
ncbi:MAG: restriction endonuclease subunit S, partial [bacterium]|nr:restriction endonuclease subunit S [bacterium]